MSFGTPSQIRFLCGPLPLAVAFLFLAGSLGLCFYRASVAAESFVADATDGPWVLSKTRLVIDFDPDRSTIHASPHWIFRFRNPATGNESRRIYVTFFGDRAFSYTGVLDPVPLLGVRP